MSDVYIIGIGQTPVTKGRGRGARLLARDAIETAIAAAEVEPSAVSALYVGNMMAGILEHQQQLAALCADSAGLRGIEAFTVEASCGSGAAALRYLHALEVDVVKIDGQYVRSAMKRPRNKAFLKAIAGLCHDLGITTIAEMVEEDDQADMLRDSGVRFGQGYLYGKPSFDIGVFATATKRKRIRKPMGKEQAALMNAKIISPTEMKAAHLSTGRPGRRPRTPQDNW